MSEKQEIGNGAKMREALEALSSWAKVVINNPKDATAIECAVFIKETIKAALAAPPRNCDVGTAEEQTERMHENYCSHHECYVIPTDAEPYGCPLYEQGVDCRLKWARMPYKEGGKK